MWSHGDFYDGDWIDGAQTGKGNLLQPNWSVTSRGIFRWAPSEEQVTPPNEKGEINGDFYEGDWVNNKKEGYGIFCWENEDKYEGDWHSDKKTGRGKFTYGIFGFFLC